MNSIQLLGAIEIGLIYSLVAIGVYITFRIMDFPDLTVDGSFTLGAAVATIMIINGYNCYLASVCAILLGALAGSITGYLHIRWSILGLLASILTMTALYSINIRIMCGPNLAIINQDTIFSGKSIIVLLLMLVLSTVFIIYLFFVSNFGLAMRGAGINSIASRAYGINVEYMKLLALVISNSIVALSGALFAQSQGFSDISMGTGTIIVGLASIIIGEGLLYPKKIIVSLLACVIGSILYRVMIAFALNTSFLGLQASDLNLVTSILITTIMMLSRDSKAYTRYR
ncbi:MAG: ABC transporter permease [Legionellales bacterium]|nr:ABC transporter permease [Legionellales bacterium]